MGRTNRSRKRRDAMNKIKRERYAAKELIQLKKTLGLIDADGNEILKEGNDLTTPKKPEEMTRKEKEAKEEAEIAIAMDEESAPAQPVEMVNEKSGVKHVYNSKTLKDQFGNYPPWFRARKTAKRIHKKAFARKKRFKQVWCTTQVPL